MCIRMLYLMKRYANLRNIFCSDKHSSVQIVWIDKYLTQTNNRMNKMAKSFLVGCAALCGCVTASIACTGISLTAKDGSYVQARTIEGAALKLISEYVIIPRGYEMQSYTPNAKNGLKFKAM